MEPRLFARYAVAAVLAVPIIAFGGPAGAELLDRVADVAPPYAGYAPPLAGVVRSPAEIIASVRSMGFDPVTRPVQRGPVYVLRAVDPNDVDVRVTVDARSGRVLTATRVARLFGEAPDDDGYGAWPASPAPGYPPAYGSWPPRPRYPEYYEQRPIPPSPMPPYGPARIYGPPVTAEPESLNRSPDRRDGLRYGEAAPGATTPRAMVELPRRLPLPRARPADAIISAASKTEPAASAAKPAMSTAGGGPVNEAAGASPAPPQQPAMVPIAPLE